MTARDITPAPLSPTEVHRRLGKLVDFNPWSLSGSLHWMVQKILSMALSYRETVGAPSTWTEFLSLHPEFTQDTFMACPLSVRPTTWGQRLLRTALRARALSEMLCSLHDQFDNQPLLVGVYRRGGLSIRRALPTGLRPPEIGILHGDRYIQVNVSGQPPLALAREISNRLQDAARDLPARVGVPAVVALNPIPLSQAWHLHRHRGLEGPWLGCAEVPAQRGYPDLEILSTRHFVVDGFAHVRILNTWRSLMEKLEKEFPDDSTLLDEFRPLPPEKPAPSRLPRLTFRIVSSPENSLHFRGLAYAFGLALHEVRKQIDPIAGKQHHTPTFLVPCVPKPGVLDGNPADDWRSQRISAVLASVRFNPDGTPEPLERFETRLHADLASEDGVTGLVSDGLRKLARCPVPPTLKPFLLRKLEEAAAGIPGPLSHLMGSGLISYIKMAPNEDSGEPRWAASWPPPYREVNLGPGGIACTIIEQNGRRSIGVAGSGACSSDSLLLHFESSFMKIQENMRK